MCARALVSVLARPQHVVHRVHALLEGNVVQVDVGGDADAHRRTERRVTLRKDQVVDRRVVLRVVEKMQYRYVPRQQRLQCAAEGQKSGAN